MIRTTAEISGMVCDMCQAHINDAIRFAFPVKKVRSSRAKGKTVILSEAPIDRERLRKTIQAAGYTLLSVCEEAIDRRTLFDILWKRRP